MGVRFTDSAGRRSGVQDKRMAFWGGPYLESAAESYRQAKSHYARGDYFTGYLYLFVAFNNIYCLLVPRSSSGEASKIRMAVTRLSDQAVEDLYTENYIRKVTRLNCRLPKQFQVGPDKGEPYRGIINMRHYFAGARAEACVEHIYVAQPDGAIEDKRKTLEELAASLLYAVRNNQFHAIKGPGNPSDENVVRISYKLLEPIVKALFGTAREQVENREPATRLPRRQIEWEAKIIT